MPIGDTPPDGGGAVQKQQQLQNQSQQNTPKNIHLQHNLQQIA